MNLRLLLVVVVLAGCGAAPVESDAGGAVDAAIEDAWIDPRPELAVESVVDIGELPHPSATVVGRDGASSGLVDGALLWTFGDTFVSTPTSWDHSHVVTATGAWATPGDPLTLEQPVDADGNPAQLIPYTDAELDANIEDATNGWALWPGAVIDTGGSDLLLLFQRIKRTEGSGFDGVGLGTARIAAHETVARRDPDDLFSRPMPPETGGEPLYGTGGVAVLGETAYFFACEGAGCRLARVPRAQADERDAFEFYDGSAWVDDIAAAAIVIRGVGAATSVTYNAYLGRYLSVTSRPFSNDVLLRTADAIEGPWPTTGVILAPSDGGIVAAGKGTNYLAQEQVALSSADGREIVISYSRPLGSFRGEVRLARIRFE